MDVYSAVFPYLKQKTTISAGVFVELERINGFSIISIGKYDLRFSVSS